jgi:multisubunit Na+/H+ antiporter MnhF subunit
MTAWIACGAALVACLVWPGLAVLRARLGGALVAMQAASVLASLALFALSLGFGQPAFVDLSLALALVGLPGALVFAYFVERWL